MIKAVIFDLGGIVVPEKTKEIEEGVADYLDISYSELTEIIKNLKPSLYTGEIRLFDLYSEVIRKLGKSVKPEKMLEIHLSLYKKTSTKRNQEILQLVEKLRVKYLVIALTNTEVEIADFNKNNGLFDYFDRAYLSTDLGLKKPQLKIYQRILDDFNLKPEETIMIDDKLEYLSGAQEIGIKTIQFKTLAQLEDELKALGLSF